jgi:hypothetical protein
MNAYEIDLIEALSDNSDRVTWRHDGASKIFEKISETHPVVGSKIDWSRLASHTCAKVWDLQQHALEFSKFFVRTSQAFPLGSEVIYAGDGLTDFSVHAPIHVIKDRLASIFSIPQHHYFLGADLPWCMCFTMEGDMDFAFPKRR